MIAVKIDPEFQSFIPPLAAEEQAALKSSLLTEGCRESLVVWAGQGILLDGHHRYALCQRHGISYRIIEREFADRHAAIVWMCQNQLARRNLSQFSRDELALRLEAEVAQTGKTHMAKGLSESDKPHDTRQQIASLAGTSTGGVAQSKIILKHAPEELKRQTRTQELSRYQAYQLTLALKHFPEADREEIFAVCGDEPAKIKILLRLYKSMVNHPDTTNATYVEILQTGGFHNGGDMDRWRDFQQASVEVIEHALQSITAHHRQHAIEAKREALAAESQDDQLPDGVQLIRADFHGLPATLAVNSVDLIFASPPYGGKDFTRADALGQLAARVLKPGGSLMCVVDPPYLLLGAQIGLHLSYISTIAALYGPRRLTANLPIENGWMPVLWFAKEPLGEKKPIHDCLSIGPIGGHVRGRALALEVLIPVFEQWSCPGAIVLGPMLGEGIVLLAALARGCRVVGIESDPQVYQIARGRILKAIYERGPAIEQVDEERGRQDGIS